METMELMVSDWWQRVGEFVGANGLRESDEEAKDFFFFFFFFKYFFLF